MNWTEKQQEVIRQKDKSLLVSAAAGAGKTAVLVERIIHKITDPENRMDVDELLVVTFTRAAAAEMRERITGKIEEKLQENPEDDHLKRQSSLIRSASIMTIDSFCLSVIRNYFYLVDLDPSFRTAEEGEMKLLKQDVLSKMLEDEYEKGSAAFLSFAEKFGSDRNKSVLTDLILQVYDCSMSEPWPEKWLEECALAYQQTDVEKMEQSAWMQNYLRSIRAQLQGMAQSLYEMAKLCETPGGPFVYADTFREEADSLEEISRAASYEDLRSKLLNFSFGKLPACRDKLVDKGLQDRIKKERDNVKKDVGSLRNKYLVQSGEEALAHLNNAGKDIKELIRLTKEFADCFAEEKKRRGVLDFDDQEHFALRILVDEESGKPTEAADELRGYFREIMIDEYQDSNYVQEMILMSIANQRPDPPNVFMVGDVKQSIYGFRKARPDLFLEKYHTYKENGESLRRIELRTNFRSRRSVLSSVNLIFSGLMQEDLGGIAYMDENALHPGDGVYKEEDTKDNRTELLLTGSDPQEEPAAVASRILQMTDRAHPFQVLDRDTGEMRDVRFSDIVILMRSLGDSADLLAQTLKDAGIPVSLQSKQGYFSAIEVQQLLAFLKVIDNPRQDIPFASVLKSPVYAFTSDELAQIRTGCPEGQFYDAVINYVNEGEDEVLRRRLQEFLEDLSLFRQKSRYLQMHELLAFVLEHTQFDTIETAMPGGQQRSANIQMLYRQAAAYDSTSYRGLFQFNRYMDQLQTYKVDYGEGTAVGENENAVRIFTIHKSKGLEFPVVFLCGLGKRFNKKELQARVLMDSKRGIGIEDVDPLKRTRCETVLRSAVYLAKESESLAEEMRVLYVAMTRAREKLILTASSSKQEEIADQMQIRQGTLTYYNRFHAGSFLDWIRLAAAGEPDIIDVKSVSPLETAGEEAVRTVSRQQRAHELEEAAESASPEELEKIEKAFSGEEKGTVETFIPAKVSVSELKEESIREQDEELYQMFEGSQITPYVPDFMRKESGEAKNGAVYGTAMHRVMECLDLEAVNSEEDLSDQISAMLADGRLSKEDGEKISLKALDGFLEDDLFARMKAAQSAGTLRREKPFVMSLPARETDPAFDSDEPVLVQGIIDAYFVEEEEIVLVDYKTDRVKDPQELSARYGRQMQLYSQALTSGTGRKVKEIYLYSFHLGTAVPVAPSG